MVLKWLVFVMFALDGGVKIHSLATRRDLPANFSMRAWDLVIVLIFLGWMLKEWF